MPQRSDESSSIPLVLGDTSVYFKFVFDVGRDIDPVDAAERLLDTDMAVVGVRRGDVWDARRVSGIMRNKFTYGQVKEAQTRIERSMASFLRYLVFKPRLWRLYFRALRRDQSETPDASGEEEPLSFDDIDDLIADAASLQTLLELVDDQVFNPDFMKDGPWTRVELQPAFLTQGEKTHSVDVWVLIHGSGSAVMTFALRFEDQVLPTELVSQSIASAPRFERTEIATWIVRTASLAYEGYEALKLEGERFSSGIWWGTWSQDDSVALTDIFGLYQDALLAALGSRRPARPTDVARPFTTQWMGYPVVCIREPDVRVFDREDEDAQEQVGALVARLPDTSGYRTEALLEFADADLAIRSDQRMWVNEGCAVMAIAPSRRRELAERYGGVDEIPGQDWLWIEQMFAVPLNLLLLQYHTAHALLSQVRSMPLDSRSLHTFKARLLRAKATLGTANHFTYGSLNLIAAAFHDSKGTKETWSLVDDALGLVDGVLDAERRAADDRRAFALQSVLGLVAILLGIPAIHQLVQLLSQVSLQGEGSWWGLGRWIDATTSLARDHSGPLVVGLVVALVVLVVLALVVARRRNRRSIPFVTRAEGPKPRRMPFQYFEASRIEWTLLTGDRSSDAAGPGTSAEGDETETNEGAAEP